MISFILAITLLTKTTSETIRLNELLYPPMSCKQFVHVEDCKQHNNNVKVFMLSNHIRKDYGREV
jgi:hypothetical protein